MRAPEPLTPRADLISRARAAAARRILDAVVRRVDVDLVIDPVTPSSPARRASQVVGASRPTIVVHRPETFFTRLGAHPKLAIGEGYTEGEWSPAAGHDLAEVLLPFAERLADAVPEPLRSLRGFANQPLPAALRNTLSGARRNIESHYDLSNEMFAAFLDPSMTYSSALFDESRPLVVQDLEEAQVRKVDAALDRAGVTAGTRLLEVGTGWGTLAIRAAERGATVVTLTLSREQAALAEKRLAEAGLADRVEVRLQDYREADGEYDAIISIEMIEAVGEEYWPTYFSTLDARLAPGGTIVVQAITMPHERYRATRRSFGWIQKYIFPGGVLPSVDAIERTCTEHTGLRVRDVHTFGQHYAETLRRWRHAFMNAGDQVRELGFDERFLRIWEFYLAYCQAGFTAGAIDVGQIVLNRPARGPIVVG